jgi:sec-independent protein translocase protein TatC
MLKIELTDIEQLTKYRRHLIVAFFVIAAIITPPDVISQFLLAIPLMILYELSILVGKFT